MQTQQGRKHWDLFRWMYDPFILHDAIQKVMENAGAAGLDGHKVDEIKGREWEHAQWLCQQLKRKAYQPGPVRRVYIPKADGRQRPLGIPDRDDRIIQTALLILLEPIYEQIFLPCSYGFRPDKRAVDCAADVANAVFRHRHVLDADIEAFFDNVSHKKLMGMLKENIVDTRILTLIQQILKTGFQEVNKPWQPTTKGTPQGGPLSPLLSNVYLHYTLDQKVEWIQSKGLNVQLFRFADDFVLVAKTKKDIDLASKWLNHWMRIAKLNLKKSKTSKVNMQNRYRCHKAKFQFLGFKFHLRAFRDNPKRFWIARQPSEKARKQLRIALRKKLIPNLSLHEAKKKAKEIWLGWAYYFRFSNANRVFYREVKSVYRAFILYLRRKYRHQRRPVPWRRLRPLLKWLKIGFRPVRVIPDLVRQRQVQQELVLS
jgi:group II intron reverse transcriptase/maturase